MCLRIYMYAYIYIHIYICTYIEICIVYTLQTCKHTYMHECTHVWRTYIPIHRYAWINTYLFTDIHIGMKAMVWYVLYCHVFYCNPTYVCVCFLKWVNIGQGSRKGHFVAANGWRIVLQYAKTRTTGNAWLFCWRNSSKTLGE